jgi:hypothetical protein
MLDSPQPSEGQDVSRPPTQVPTRLTSTATVMSRPDFQSGFEEVRAGQRPRFDDFYDRYWSYERGRLFGCIAPTSMPLFIGGRLNPKAVALCEAATDRGLIP